MPIGSSVAKWAPRVAITPDPATESKQAASLWRRLLWFVGLWSMGALFMSLIIAVIGLWVAA